MQAETKLKAWLYGLILIGIAVSVIALFSTSIWFTAAGLAVFVLGILTIVMNKASSASLHSGNEQQEQFRTFIQESQVVADRLAAAVEEVNRSIGQLLHIADASIQGKRI